jgi:glycosyltransferase involved in cell wall biosynthesis
LESGASRLRHCMVVDNRYPDPRVEREAAALLARGHSVDVICARGDGEPSTERIDGVSVHRLPVRRRRGSGLVSQMIEYVAFTAWAAAMLMRLQARRRYDVVQVHNVPDFLVLAALPARVRGTPVILDLHDLMPEFFASRFVGDMRSLPVRLVLLQERISRALADHVITVTDLWRDTLLSRGARPERVSVVMNVPHDDLYPRHEPVPTRDGPVTVVYHGTMTRRYGIDVLLEAIHLARQRADVRLRMHGRGEFLADVLRRVSELGLDDITTITSERISAEELTRVIRSADLGVVPNRNDVFTDGILPTKLMEYAALGVPAIVASSSATRAYFTDDMVRFVTPGDAEELAAAIVELAADGEARRAMAARAQAFTDRHPWRTEAARYADLVERIAAGAPGRAAT